MKLLVCVILPLLAWGAPADLVKDESISEESLKPLIRTKRADEEIMFGNHQNEARVVKKSDPSLHVVDENALIDNNMDMSKKAESDDVILKGDVITKGDDVPDVNAVFSDDAQSVGDLAEGDASNEEDPLVSNDSASVLNEGDIEKEEDMSSGETQDEQNTLPSKDYRDYYDYFFPYVGLRRFRRSNLKEKRAAAPSSKLLTAEDMTDDSMTSQARANQRVKRDLTADELYDWLENGDVTSDAEDSPSMGYYPEYDTDNVEGDGTWNNRALEQLLEEEEAEEYPRQQDTLSEYPQQQDTLSEYPFDQDYGEEEGTDNNPELLSLLEYLVENEAAPQQDANPLGAIYPQQDVNPLGAIYPQQDENPLGAIYPEDVQENWEDLDLNPDVKYQPIVYQGVPGIFIPMEPKLASREVVVNKRQYLSLMPGLKKRSWYPYNNEPEGGRWGAFVTPEEEKRTADAYDRLYRLAQALNPQDRNYMNYE